MKKWFMTLMMAAVCFLCTALPAHAVVNDTVKVGLYYGASSLFSANLENAVGSGYAFGYFTGDRIFVPLGLTAEKAISMTVDGTVYLSGGVYSASTPSGNYERLGAWRIELGPYDFFEEAAARAEELDGWPVWTDCQYAVRLGCYGNREEAEAARSNKGLDGRVVSADGGGVLITRTKTARILFEFEGGRENLAVRPTGADGDTATWFKNNRYPGSFEYIPYGGSLQVINVVNVEDYVKGVIPYEMSSSWPVAALEAQAVCARTYACKTRHSSSGFDICNSTHCQVYYGRGNTTRGPSETTDRAVDACAGEVLYYEGTLVDTAVYQACDGGATEDAANVWGSEVPYLKGKADPYEAQTPIPGYSYSVTYTSKELTYILTQKDYDVGTVKNVYISALTPMGNVSKVTFEGTRGTRTVTGETCRTIFSSATYNKSVRSMRFRINGETPSMLYVNGMQNPLGALNGVSVLTGSGKISTLKGNTFTALTASGKVTVGEEKPAAAGKDTFVITGTGNGHNVGLSQYGAKAMAELGYTYREILEFYYTDITVERGI